MRSVVLIAVVGLGGCETPSERRAQACTDALLERPEVDPAGVDTVWVVDSVDMPSGATEANQFGFNLDCDVQGRPDNAVGQIVSTIYSQESSDIDAEIKALIDAGRLIELFTIRSTGLVDAAGVGLTLRHGTGTEPYGIDVARGSGTITGTIVGGELDVQGGQLPLGLALPSLDEVIVLPIEDAHVRATISGDRMEGRIGGGIPKGAWDLVAMPFIHRALTRAIERDCPDLVIGQPPCRCTPGTFGETLLELFDEEPADCEVTLDELRNNSLARALTAPDVDLFDENGELRPRTDGIKDCLSIGLGFTAVPTSVVEP